MEENDTECEVLLKHIVNCQKGRVAAMERGMDGRFQFGNHKPKGNPSSYVNR